MKKHMLATALTLAILSPFTNETKAQTYQDITKKEFEIIVPDIPLISPVLQKFNNFNVRNLPTMAPAIGSGIGLDLQIHELNTFYQNGLFFLFDTTRDDVIIQTLDSNVVVLNSLNNEFNEEFQRSGVTAHINMGKILEYFQLHFDRKGYSNGVEYNNIIIDYPNYSNAIWNGSVIILGEGNGVTTQQFAHSLDILAHEFTHAFLSNEVGFTYSGESGALEESLADTFAIFIDRENFKIGEDVFINNTDDKKAIRSLENPPEFNQPEHYRDYVNLPLDADNDYGGVHINSGIPNKAAYLTIEALGFEKAEQIYYHAVTNYFTATATFNDAKRYLIQSTLDLYDEKTAEVVEKCWNDVGI